jgi:hypothetical protein
MCNAQTGPVLNFINAFLIAGQLLSPQALAN